MLIVRRRCRILLHLLPFQMETAPTISNLSNIVLSLTVFHRVHRIIFPWRLLRPFAELHSIVDEHCSLLVIQVRSVHLWINLKFDFVVFVGSGSWRRIFRLFTLVENLTEQSFSICCEAEAHFWVDEIRVVFPVVVKFVFTGAWYPLFIHCLLLYEVRIFLFGMCCSLRLFERQRGYSRTDVMWHAPLSFLKLAVVE